ncbi:hypothetical protein [Gaopeijia maritima]|uniref:Uncharacterized protein n=1 Tax=Gaopeijia maritima TaxID=3119007 RepID=A0ABU9E6N1_9BACT
MVERRYDDEEVREILVRATELKPELPALAATSPSTEGLTLEELQAAAREAGIAPDRVAEAAHELVLDRAVLSPVTTRMGLPVSTSHAVRIPRMLTPGEWDRFVVRLRDTFGTPGEVRIEGSLRTWFHGNLRVLLEPLEEGARLRFESRDDHGAGMIEGGLAALWGGGFLLLLLVLVAVFKGESVPWGLWALSGSLPAAAAAMIPIGRRHASKWLPGRHRQFEVLGEEARRVALKAGGDDV